MPDTHLRHAWMIIAHSNFELLERQLRFLDSDQADFFIHIDAKVKDFDFDRFRAIPRHSSVTFTNRVNVSWGHYSMVEAELLLLRAAVPGNYDYYHLLSGVDIPLKTRTYIESYFDREPGRNYINFAAPVISRTNLWRVRFYYPFQKKNIRKPFVRKALRNTTAGLQLIAGVNRTKKVPKNIVFQKGTQWFSITNSFARYLIEQEPLIYKLFRDTYCPDELFVQTLAVSSPFRDSLAPTAFNGKHVNCCRYIDWKRGNPYTFTDTDFEELVSTGPDALFARKFSWTGTSCVADRLFTYFSES